MRQDGTNFTCDRCGKTEFTTVYGVVLPCGWSNRDDKDLCPTCTDAYNTMMNNFYAPEVKRPLELDDSSREVVNGRVVL